MKDPTGKVSTVEKLLQNRQFVGELYRQIEYLLKKAPIEKMNSLISKEVRKDEMKDKSDENQETRKESKDNSTVERSWEARDQIISIKELIFQREVDHMRRYNTLPRMVIANDPNLAILYRTNFQLDKAGHIVRYLRIYFKAWEDQIWESPRYDP